ncbi:MAG: 3-hydroxyacyl-CoA dehydrogenase [Candidatus Bathyarchaeia archaeon]
MELTDVRNTAVIGSGVMGRGISQLLAMAEYGVVLMDIRTESLEGALRQVRWSLSKFVEKGKITQERAHEALGRIKTTSSVKEAVENADLVIEAISEDIELKKGVFKKIDSIAPRGTIIATNTSTIPITILGGATGRPHKVVGMHFSNPPVLMPLVEVTRGEGTHEETLEIILDLSKKLGKEPIVVERDLWGFVLNRIFLPFLDEAAWIVFRGEGTIEAVDSAVKSEMELRMGPFETCDLVGIDIVNSFHRIARELAGTRWMEGYPFEPSPMVEDYVRRGWFGIKSGRGFYRYTKPGVYERARTPSRVKEGVDTNRLIAPSVNEASWLVRNHVAPIESVDRIAKLGLGFPKGILEMADEIGLDVIVEVLKASRKKYGKAYYEPDPLLLSHLERGWIGKRSGRGFYEY